MEMTCKEAINVLGNSFKKNPDFAWSWHCSLAMSYFDAGGDIRTANKAAAKFMLLSFGIDTTNHPTYIELTSSST